MHRSDLVEAILSCEGLKEHVVERIMQNVDEECKHLCSVNFNSLLRNTKAKSLGDINMANLIAEWRKEAVVCYKFLVISADSPNACDEVYLLSMAGSILLKTRNIHMSALQHLTGLLLFHGNATKQVCSINYTMLCTCMYTSIIL